MGGFNFKSYVASLLIFMPAASPETAFPFACGHKNPGCAGAFEVGGEGGIRTPGAFDSTPDFESGTFDHSDTSPFAFR